MISYSDQRHVLGCAGTSKQLFRQHHPSLLVPFATAGQRKIHLVKCEHVFVRRNLLLSLRDDGLVILFGVKPDFAIDADDQKKRFPVALRIDGLSDFGGHEQTILIVDRELVFTEENGMLHGDLFPLIHEDVGISTTSFHLIKNKFAGEPVFLRSAIGLTLRLRTEAASYPQCGK